MVIIYKATDSTSSVQQFQITRIERAYELANLALVAIREKERITQPAIYKS